MKDCTIVEHHQMCIHFLLPIGYFILEKKILRNMLFKDKFFERMCYQFNVTTLMRIKHVCRCAYYSWEKWLISFGCKVKNKSQF